jgi:hypothetical protein
MDWKECTVELPPKDGWYQVCNDGNAIGVCFYDGIGFLYEENYRYPTFWKEIKEVEKRYGKVKND